MCVCVCVWRWWSSPCVRVVVCDGGVLVSALVSVLDMGGDGWREHIQMPIRADRPPVSNAFSMLSHQYLELVWRGR